MCVQFGLFNYSTIYYCKAVGFFKLMALFDNFPVFKDVYQFLVKIFDCTKDFTREYKFTLGELKKNQRNANSNYPKVAVQWLNQALYFVSCSVVAESFRLRNRQLLVAAKRYSQW